MVYSTRYIVYNILEWFSLTRETNFSVYSTNTLYYTRFRRAEILAN